MSSACVIKPVCVDEPEEVKVLKFGKVVAPVPSSYVGESKAPFVAQLLQKSESMKYLLNLVFGNRAPVF